METDKTVTKEQEPEKNPVQTKSEPKKKATAKKKTVTSTAKTEQKTAESTAVKAPAAKRPGRKKGQTVKKVKAPEVKAVSKKDDKNNVVFVKPTFEFNGTKYTEDTINNMVTEYLKKHPYIVAEKVETFVNVEENRIYFTVNGFGNPDFTLSLKKA